MTIQKSISPYATLQSFEKLFKEYYERLCAYANSKIHNMDAAEDVVHEVFIKVWETKEKLSEEQSVKSYLFTSVHNRCLNYIRDNKKFAQGSEYFDNANVTEEINEAEVQQADLEAKVHAAIKKLPERCREVFELCKLQELKYAEVAEKLSISIKTVENQMGKALKVLREELGGLFVLALFIFFEGLIGVSDMLMCSM